MIMAKREIAAVLRSRTRGALFDCDSANRILSARDPAAGCDGKVDQADIVVSSLEVKHGTGAG